MTTAESRIEARLALIEKRLDTMTELLRMLLRLINRVAGKAENDPPSVGS